ncbi:hypothetical protein F5B20DRAFT_595305 [Whalleya microplaca]|nr:hypothetical protein F5B20DRAFT_595305 [Whalleya microplaca]
MPPVSSDNDLPNSLNTLTKQVKIVEKLLSEHFNCQAKHIDRSPIQGSFSRTLFVTLEDAREVVVQFRTEPLDLDPFRTARGALGSYVPDCGALENKEIEEEGAWAYCFARIPGQLWHHGVRAKGAQGRITISRSLGSVFSKGYLAENSKAVVGKICRHLDSIITSSLLEVVPYRGILQSFIVRLEELAQLPLWVAHYDLNALNVLVDDDCRVTGLVDWELSSPLPFGVGFGRIHTIAGKFTNGDFYMPNEFESAERGFWKGLFDGMPDDIRRTVEMRDHLVQDAVILGTLMDCFFYEDGKVGFNPVALKALPKFLTYRIPSLRKDRPPYEM